MGAIEKKRSTPTSPTPLAAYMREVSRSRVLTAEEEQTAAKRIQSLRDGLWRAIFSYPPFVGGICENLTQALEGTDPEVRDSAQSALHEITRAARAYRDRETRANQDAYHAARAGAAEAMAKLDVDGDHSDRIRESLFAVAQGERADVCFEYTAPPRNSKPYGATSSGCGPPTGRFST